MVVWTAVLLQAIFTAILRSECPSSSRVTILARWTSESDAFRPIFWKNWKRAICVPISSCECNRATGGWIHYSYPLQRNPYWTCIKRVHTNWRNEFLLNDRNFRGGLKTFTNDCNKSSLCYSFFDLKYWWNLLLKNRTRSIRTILYSSKLYACLSKKFTFISHKSWLYSLKKK